MDKIKVIWKKVDDRETYLGYEENKNYPIVMVTEKVYGWYWSIIPYYAGESGMMATKSAAFEECGVAMKECMEHIAENSQ